MEEAAELDNYLPLSFKRPKEQEYIELCLTFDANALAATRREQHPCFLEKAMKAAIPMCSPAEALRRRERSILRGRSHSS